MGRNHITRLLIACMTVCFVIAVQTTPAASDETASVDDGTMNPDSTAVEETIDTEAKVLEAAETYIESHSKDGMFMFHDPQTGNEVALELVRLSDDVTGEEGEYSVSGTFEDAEDATYELSFIVAEVDSKFIVNDVTGSKTSDSE